MEFEVNWSQDFWWIHILNVDYSWYRREHLGLPLGELQDCWTQWIWVHRFSMIKDQKGLSIECSQTQYQSKLDLDKVARRELGVVALWTYSILQLEATNHCNGSSTGPNSTVHIGVMLPGIQEGGAGIAGSQTQRQHICEFSHVSTNCKVWTFPRFVLGNVCFSDGCFYWFYGQ